MQQEKIDSVVPPADSDLSLIDVALVLISRAKLLVVAPLLVGSLTVAASFLITPTFKASAQLMPPQQQASAAAALLGSLGSLAGMAGGITGIKSPSDQIISLLMSRTVADNIVARFKLDDIYSVDYKSQAREELARRTHISAGKDGLIDVEFEDESPQRSRDVVNSYIEELKKLTRNLAVGEAGQRRLFFETQLEDVKSKLATAEQALQANGINLATIKTNPQAAVAAISEIQAQLAAKQVEIAALRRFLTDNSPDLQRSLTEYTALQQLLKKSQQRDSGTADSNGSEYVSKYRDFRYYETLFELFARQYELAKVDEANEGVVVQVVDAPEIPELKSKPKRALLGILSATLTFLAAVLYILSQDALRTLSRNEEQRNKIDRFKAGLWLRR